MQRYRDFVGIIQNDYFCLNVDLLVGECNIPYDGVQEVCMLHDVIEDTEITIDEIGEIYSDFGLERYFRLYIKEALLLVTHDKNEDYLVYIKKLLFNPTFLAFSLVSLDNHKNFTLLLYLKRFYISPSSSSSPPASAVSEATSS